MIRILPAVLLCISIALPVHANFDKAMQAYQAGEFEDAHRSFDALAAIGDHSSAFNLGVMHYRGEYVEQDPVEAWAWMQLAGSQSGHAPFSQTAAKVFAKLTPEHQDAARSRFEALLHSHSDERIFEELTPALLSDEECTADREIVTKKQPSYPQKQLRKGNFGRVVLEYLVMPSGHVRDITIAESTNPDFSRAAAKSAYSYRYKPAVQAEPSDGYRTTVSFSIVGGISNTKVLMAELDDLKGKAESGDAVAQFVYAARLGVFRSFRNYLKGVDLDYQAANKWYLESARQGIPNAQFQIGRNMVLGRGCEADSVNGLKWINAAAASGLPEAQNYLATSAKSLPEDERRAHAIRWLKNAAINGHYFSKLLLAWELVSGHDSPSAADIGYAAELLEEKSTDYFDEVRVLETKAALAAAKQDMKAAKRYQKKAVKIARRHGWDLRDVNHRYESYQRGERWIGPYYYDIAIDSGDLDAGAG